MRAALVAGGTLDAIAGRMESATERLRIAVAHYESIGAAPWSALARCDLATVAGPRRLARDANERARALGLDLEAIALQLG